MMKYNSLIELLLNEPDNLRSSTITYYNNGDIANHPILYKELSLKAKLLAKWLVNNNFAKQRVLLSFGPGIEFIEAFLACQFANAIAVPVVPISLTANEHKIGRLVSILRDCQPKLVLGTQRTILGYDEFVVNYPEFSNICWESIEDLNTPIMLDNFQIEVPDINDLALLQYTSGSTSMPKGVMLSHKNLFTNLKHFDQDWNHSSESTLVSWLPHFHDLGLVYGTLFPIYKGINGVLLPSTSIVQQPIRWLKAISETKGTHSMGPNFIYDLCLKRITDKECEELDLSSWRMALNAAEPIRMDTIRRFISKFGKYGFSDTTFTGAWGLAESTCLVTGQRWNENPKSIYLSSKALSKGIVTQVEKSESHSEFVSCGKARDGMDIKIVHSESKQECLPDEIGEIWVKGPSVAHGYWNRDLETTSTFGNKIQECKDESLYMRTGDLGFINNDEIFICGRMKDVIIIRGENYYPQDIEQVVEISHPAFKESCCAVFSIKKDEEECIVVVQEVIRHYDKWPFDEMFHAIRRTISLTSDLPVESIILIRPGTTNKTSSGKIQRGASKLSYLQDTLSIVSQWDRSKKKEPKSVIGVDKNHIEKDLVARLMTYSKLSEESVGLMTPFIDLGLGSLGATVLSGELASYYNIPLSPTVFYDFPHISALTNHMVSLLKTSDIQSQETINEKNKSVESSAVIGMACCFPGAPSLDDYWSLLESGESSITTRTYDNQQKIWGGFIENVEFFDHEFFGITRREATRMDPQQRISLQVAWQAIEDAGLNCEKLKGKKVGVFFGASAFDYGAIQLNKNEPDAYAAQGSSLAVIANRISYQFDFRGPSLVVDTACSSSLSALHLARKSLSFNECDIALVGGVNLLLMPEINASLDKAGMLSPSNSCKTFDATADGYVRAEGCGIVILKRLSDAEQNNDRIYGVLINSVMAQDGRSNGLTAPNGLAQEAMLRESLQSSGIVPEELQYFETHGTGTPLGDPIECNTLGRVLGKRTTPCHIGSVKANLGHLEAAAGMAGLIKVMLSLKHETIPQQINFTQINPVIELPKNIKISKINYPWKATELPRYACINAFGFSGTNVNVIVSDHVASTFNKSRPYNPRKLPLIISAHNQSSLIQWCSASLAKLESNNSIDWQNYLYTSACYRQEHSIRFAAVIESKSELISYLKDIIDNKSLINSPKKPLKIAFSYSNDCISFLQTGCSLINKFPLFRNIIRECAPNINPIIEGNIEALLSNAKLIEAINSPVLVQSLNFVLQYALTRTLMEIGITPQLLLGHGFGELMVLVTAGSLTLEDALKLVVLKVNLLQQSDNKNLTITIFENETIVSNIINEIGLPINIVAVNNHKHCLASGSEKDIRTISEYLSKCNNIDYTISPIEQFYYSKLETQSAIERWKSVLDNCKFSLPKVSFISNSIGTILPKGEAIDHIVIRESIGKPIRFTSSLDLLAESEIDVVIEINSSRVITEIAKEYLNNHNLNWSSVIDNCNTDDWSAFLNCVTQLWTNGYSIKWSYFFTNNDYNFISLPPYCFNKESFWVKRDVRDISDKEEHLKNCNCKCSSQCEENNNSSGEISNKGQSTSEKIKIILTKLLYDNSFDIPESESLIDLGIDSIILLEFTLVLKQEFGVEITPLNIFDSYQSIEKISDYLDSYRDENKNS